MSTNRLFADLSDNQPSVDFHKYASAGHLLVALKVGEGVGSIQPVYAGRAHAAHRAGLVVWHYHFCRPDLHQDGTGEMDSFWGAAHPHFVKGDRLVLDLEIAHPRGPAACGAYLRKLDARLHQLSSQEALGYSYQSFIANELGGGNVRSGQWWAAAYQTGWPRLPRHFKTFARQYSDGIHGPQPHVFAGIGQCDGSQLTRFRYAQLLRARRHR